VPVCVPVPDQEADIASEARQSPDSTERLWLASLPLRSPLLDPRLRGDDGQSCPARFCGVGPDPWSLTPVFAVSPFPFVLCLTFIQPTTGRMRS